MEKRVLLLRLSYWIPAVADFVVAYRALIPEKMGLEGVAYPMGLVSAIAFSWGVMLLIADRKPLERRWVLIPTIIVVGLLTIVRAIFAEKGLIEPSYGVLGFGAALVLLMSYSYYRAGTSANGQTKTGAP